jgi:hypothetical protein
MQQWQFLVKSPPNPYLVEAPLGTDTLKLHKGLRKAESLLAIQLRTGINDLNTFLFQARVSTMAEDSKWQNTSLSFCLGMLGHTMS